MIKQGEWMKQGRIITIVSSSYQVEVEENGQKQMYICSARGKMKQEEQTPVVGDFVQIEVVEEEKKQGVILEILPRSNYSKRPKIANLTQLVFVISLKMPKPDLLLLDKQLAYANWLEMKPIICINKVDLGTPEVLRQIQSLYEKIGYRVLTTNAKEKEGILELKKTLIQEVTAFSGNSGVGKSTIIDRILPNAHVKIGAVSTSHHKGMHTTTFSEMYPLPQGGYIIDTPGIKGFGTIDFNPNEVAHFFPEIFEISQNCRFNNCTHRHEPGCAVLKALENHKISESRYTSYLSIIEDSSEGKYREAF